MSDLATKSRPLIPHLASGADGEVLATVAAIRRVLRADGLDLHDLASGLTAHEPTSADLAAECAASRVERREHELDFLNKASLFASRWPALSEHQAKWIRDLQLRVKVAEEPA